MIRFSEHIIHRKLDICCWYIWYFNYFLGFMFVDTENTEIRRILFDIFFLSFSLCWLIFADISYALLWFMYQKYGIFWIIIIIFLFLFFFLLLCKRETDRHEKWLTDKLVHLIYGKFYRSIFHFYHPKKVSLCSPFQTQFDFYISSFVSSYWVIWMEWISCKTYLNMKSFPLFIVSNMKENRKSVFYFVLFFYFFFLLHKRVDFISEK